jgi:hypothetical protein
MRGDELLPTAFPEPAELCWLLNEGCDLGEGSDLLGALNRWLSEHYWFHGSGVTDQAITMPPRIPIVSAGVGAVEAAPPFEPRPALLQAEPTPRPFPVSRVGAAVQICGFCSTARRPENTSGR